MNKIVLGIDVGGTHITISQVDIYKREVIENTTLRILIDSNKSVIEVVDSWVKGILNVIGGLNIDTIKIGIAFPGPFDYENGICLIQNQDKYEHFYKVNVREKLAGKLGISGNHIFFMNDAACFLKGELFSNNIIGFNNPLGITIGTGFGTSKLSDGQIIDAALWQKPFKLGIAEEYLSTRWFHEKYFSFTGKRDVSVKNIAYIATQKDEPEQMLCKRIFEEFGENLAKFIIELCPILHPDVIVLGGNIGKAIALFEPTFKARLVTNGLKIPLQLSLLGEYAAIIGAASICNSNAPQYI